MNFDIVVVGAGASGVALCDLASRAGYKVAVLDHSVATGFASVRNQGWLHSGALYAAGHGSENSSTVERCIRGSRALLQLDEELGLDSVGETPGIMVFDAKDELDLSYERIRAHRIAVKRVAAVEVDHIEPILGRRTDIVGGLLIPDYIMNTPNILRALFWRSLAHGCVHFTAAGNAFDDVSFSFVDGMWRITIASNLTISATKLVLACGTLMPELAARISPAADIGRIHKSIVFALRCDAVKRLVIMKSPGTSYMNIAPFAGGITVNLGGDDHSAIRAQDNKVEVEHFKMILDTIEDFLPGLHRFCPIDGRAYCCQKLIPDLPEGASRAALRDFFIKDLGNCLFGFYTGKFTQCLVAAESMLSRLGLSPGSQSTRAALPLVEFKYEHPGLSNPEGVLHSADRKFDWVVQGS